LCSRNKLRSPTAEQVFSGREDIDIASAGLNADAEVPLPHDQHMLRPSVVGRLLQALEQMSDEIAFLGCHSPLLSGRRVCSRRYPSPGIWEDAPCFQWRRRAVDILSGAASDLTLCP